MVMGSATSEEYAWVLMCAVVMVIQLMYTGYSIVPLRARLFSEKYFRDHFPELSYREYALNGYPDMGHGRFAAKLSMEEWMRFASWQRSHMHYVENIAIVLVLTLISGLFAVRLTVFVALCYILGREIYRIGYRRMGPNGRQPGAYVMAACVMTLAIVSVVGLFRHGGGVDGAIKLIPEALYKGLFSKLS